MCAVIVRSASELADVDRPAWSSVEQLIEDAAAPVTVLDIDGDQGARTLVRLQVTAGSTLGVLALNCGAC